jgi:hypothetical protein
MPMCASESDVDPGAAQRGWGPRQRFKGWWLRWTRPGSWYGVGIRAWPRVGPTLDPPRSFRIEEHTL